MLLQVPTPNMAAHRPRTLTNRSQRQWMVVDLEMSSMLRRAPHDWTSFMATAPVGAGLWTLDFGCPNTSAFPTGYSTIIDVTGTPGFLFLSSEKTWMVK